MCTKIFEKCSIFVILSIQGWVNWLKWIPSNVAKFLYFRRDQRCIPFMVGRRFCIGQSLAEKQLFLFFANLLRKVLDHFGYQVPRTVLLRS